MPVARRLIAAAGPILRNCAMIASVLSLGFALQFNNGFLSSEGIACLTSSIVTLALALGWPKQAPASRRACLVVEALMLASALAEALLLHWPPTPDIQKASSLEHSVLRAILASMALALVAIVVAEWNGGAARRLAFPAFIILFGAFGVVLVHSAGRPLIDVWTFQQQGEAMLRSGRNPYGQTFPNPYHDVQFYGRNLATKDKLLFGFPYPPECLLLTSGAVAVAGDCRYMHVLSMMAAGLLLGYCRPGLLPKLAAALLLLAPPMPHIIDQAWTEPIVVMCLAGTIWCACNRPRLTPIALGLLLGSKQYAILLMPLTFLLLPQPWTWKAWAKLLARAGAIALAIAFPFALGHWREFFRSLILVQWLAPWRNDALAYFSLLPQVRGAPALAAQLLVLLAAFAASILWAPRDLRGFALGAAFVLLALFAFSKQATCNYYLVPIASMCCGLAASSHPGAKDECY